MSKEEQAIQALQYLPDEGFIAAGYRDGEPALFLTTELSEAQEAMRFRLKRRVDPSDWWKNEAKK